MLLSVCESPPFQAITVKPFYSPSSSSDSSPLPMLLGSSSIPATSIFDVFCCFKSISYPSIYPLLILIPLFFLILCFISPDPHSRASSHSPSPLSLSYLSCFAPISHTLSPPLLHCSPLPISPPIPVFLVSG